MLASLTIKFKNTVLSLKNKLKAVFFLYISYLHKKFLWGIFSGIDEKFFKFLIVGAINAIFAYIIYALFITIGLEHNLALFFQYIIGVLWNFKTTGSIVFKNKNNTLLLKFIFTYILTFIINSVALNYLAPRIGDYLSQGILILPVAIVSFLLFKFWVFRK